jgi:putative protease
LQADVGCRNTLFNGKAQTGARHLPALVAAGLTRVRIELLDESPAAAADTIRAYQDLVAGSIRPQSLLDRVQALEKLGVTEGTLAGPD